MKRTYAGLFAAVGWFAVIGQYFVAHAGTLAGVVDYLSYFTILSNILVATTLTSVAIAPRSRPADFLTWPPVAMATAVYITVTGLTFYFILSRLYDLEGWTRHLDHLLHYVMPPAYVVFWLAFVRKGTLRLRHVVWMLAPPLIYAGWTVVHGAFSGFYPYPFVDISKLGYPKFFRNVGEFIVFFSLVGSICVLIDRLAGRARKGTGLVPGSSF